MLKCRKTAAQPQYKAGLPSKLHSERSERILKEYEKGVSAFFMDQDWRKSFSHKVRHPACPRNREV
jgi:hypothetical protein